LCIHREVSQVQVVNNEILPDYIDGKTIRLDVNITFNDGESADLEMQMEKSNDDLTARAVLYASRLVSAQSKKGEPYKKLKRIYQIFFVNDIIFPHSPLVPRRYHLIEDIEQNRLSDLIEILFYELPKLEDKVHRLSERNAGVENLSPEEKWCIFFKYHQDEGKTELIKELSREEEGIMQAEKILNKVSKEQEEWARALSREKAEMDYRSELYATHEMGLQEGLKRGLGQGPEAKALEVAKSLINRGQSLKDIAEITGLDFATVKALAQETS
jgi:predicted transposase/invertase (TIGR01784 family)